MSRVAQLRVEVHGVELPGRRFGSYEGLQVGLVVGEDIVGLVPGDAAEGRWKTEVCVRGLDDDGYDFTGPAVVGQCGDRSVKLAWLNGDEELCPAAKLSLDRVPAAMIAHALRNDASLVATIRLTDDHGGPPCADVPVSLISWTAARPQSAAPSVCG
jgi:hypothetical protein